MRKEKQAVVEKQKQKQKNTVYSPSCSPLFTYQSNNVSNSRAGTSYSRLQGHNVYSHEDRGFLVSIVLLFSSIFLNNSPTTSNLFWYSMCCRRQRYPG